MQLRGLGPGTTLTLINGQRQGASGLQGMFTDVSTIPASAVERIEILPEGAAALYGSDAIGGVVNIILRRNFNGSETAPAHEYRGRRCRRAGNRTTLGSCLVAWPCAVGLSVQRQRRPGVQRACLLRRNGDFRRFGGSDVRGVGSNPGTILDPDTLNRSLPFHTGRTVRSSRRSSSSQALSTIRTMSSTTTFCPVRPCAAPS